VAFRPKGHHARNRRIQTSDALAFTCLFFHTIFCLLDNNFRLVAYTNQLLSWLDYRTIEK